LLLVFLRVALVALLVAGPASSLQYSNGGVYDASRHERFTPGTLFTSTPVENPSFYLADYASDLNAVGWQINGHALKVTLVTPQHFLNADHWKAQGSVSFVDGTGTVRSYAIASNEKVFGDIAVGTLVAPIPPADGITPLPIASFARVNHQGRELHYVGNTPGGTGFAVGRSAISTTSTNSILLNNNLVGPQFSVDRTYGVTGDSGAPSLFAEADGLTFVGTHYSALTDHIAGSKAARAALDDYMAADGQLLDVYGEGRLGDPASGDWVVTGVSEDLGLHFDVSPGDSEAVTIRLHDFSGDGVTVEAAVAGLGYGVRVPGTSPLLSQLALAVPSDGTGAALEVVSAPASPGSTGTLFLSAGGIDYVVPLDNEAPDLGMRPASMVASPAYQSGRTGSNQVPSDTRTYTIDVTNNDVGGTSATFVYSAGCPKSTATGCSSGWNFQFVPSSQTVLAGDTETVNVHVTPAQDLPLAVFNIEIVAQDASAAIHNASTSTIYWVDSTASDVTPPTAVTNLWATGDASATTLTWNLSTDDVGIARYQVDRDGEYLASAYQGRYTDSRTRRGYVHVYRVWAEDAAGHRSPPSAAIYVQDGVVVSGGGDPDESGPICIATRKNEKGPACTDGVDNDCDGMIDGADGDC